MKTATTWTLKYYVKGKPKWVSTGTTDRNEALKMLRQRMAKASRYSEYSDELERVVMNQLFDLLIEDYRLEKRSSTYDTELRVDKHLRPFFGDKKAVDVTSKTIKVYIADREKVAEAATINKELSFVRRAFELGVTNEPPLVERVPYVRKLRLDNARSGIMSHEAYRSIRDSLPPYARIALVIGYHTGARKGRDQQDPT